MHNIALTTIYIGFFGFIAVRTGIQKVSFHKAVVEAVIGAGVTFAALRFLVFEFERYFL